MKKTIMKTIRKIICVDDVENTPALSGAMNVGKLYSNPHAAVKEQTMNRSESIKELALALSKAQAEISPAEKDAENPHFRSHYATLTSTIEACRPMTKQGLSFVQAVISNGEGLALETMLMHQSGEWICSVTPLLLDKQNMQGLGSAISYAKRYALAAMIGVSSDKDDDGEEASKDDDKKQAPSFSIQKGIYNNIAQNQRIVTDEPKPNDGIQAPKPLPKPRREDSQANKHYSLQELNNTIMLFGNPKIKGRTFQAIRNDLTVGFEQVLNFFSWVEKTAEEEGKPISGVMKILR